jgi:hypothetical protein
MTVRVIEAESKDCRTVGAMRATHVQQANPQCSILRGGEVAQGERQLRTRLAECHRAIPT